MIRRSEDTVNIGVHTINLLVSLTKLAASMDGNWKIDFTQINVSDKLV